MLLIKCKYLDTTCISRNAKRTIKLICLILAIFNAKCGPLSYPQIIFIFGLTLDSYIVRYGAAFSLLLYFPFVAAQFGDPVSHKYAGKGYQLTKGIGRRRVSADEEYQLTKGNSRRRVSADEGYQPTKGFSRQREPTKGINWRREPTKGISRRTTRPDKFRVIDMSLKHVSRQIPRNVCTNWLFNWYQ